MALSVQRSDLITFVRNNYYDKLDTVANTRIDRAIENGLRRASRARDWSFLVSTQKLNTVAPYSTGTVDISHGSASVTGTGTTFPSDAVGAFIEFNGEDGWYEITVRGGDTSLTIRDNYSNTGGDDLSGASYTIVYPLISLPANFRTKLALFDPGRRRYLRFVHEPQLWWTHGARAGSGQPEAYSIVGLPHDPNDRRLLLYPAPNAIENYELVYTRHAGWYDTSTPATSTFNTKAQADTDYVDWPDEMLDVLYTSCLYSLAAELGSNKESKYASQYYEVLEQAMADDEENGEIRLLSDNSGMGRTQRFFISS